MACKTIKFHVCEGRNEIMDTKQIMKAGWGIKSEYDRE
jgi:hypothetical protein